MRVFFRDLKLWFLAGWCFLRRRHVSTTTIGDFSRRGFRPVPIHQCQRCGWIFIPAIVAASARKERAIK